VGGIGSIYKKRSQRLVLMTLDGNENICVHARD